MIKASSLLTIILLFCIQVSQAQKDSVWIESDSHCKVYNPNPVKNENITWSGECVNGYADGFGTLIWFKNGRENQRYEGTMTRGKQHGTGRYDYGGGSIYVGEYQKSKQHGKGLMVYKNNKNQVEYSYNGDYYAGEHQGFADEVTYFYGDTLSHYSGQFANGERNGNGFLKEYKDDKITITKGTFIAGVIREGQIDKYVYFNKKEIYHFTGAVLNGKYHGMGELKEGLNRYVGNWEKGEKEGSGKLFYADSLIYEGDWHHGVFEGYGKRVFPDKSVYIGEFRNHKLDGFGIFNIKTGEIYIGQFSKNLFHGVGYTTNANGQILSSGTWANGLLTWKDNGAIKTIQVKYAAELKKANYFRVNASLKK